MERDVNSTGRPSVNRKNIKIVIAVLLAIIGSGAVVVFAMNALRQPETADFKKFDTQRQIVDSSMNVYIPLFDGFVSEYLNLHVEERADDEKTAFKEQSLEVFETEQRANEAHLKSMASSVALKEPAVKSAFESFESKYSAVVDYYAQRTKNVANITESVAGPCARMSRLNVSKESFASDYTAAADTCMQALTTAKKTSDPTTSALLSDVEALIKTRRDKFEEIIGTEGFEKNARTMIAIVELLDINADVTRAQDSYQAKAQAEYSRLVKDANEANAALTKALQGFIAARSTKGSEV